MSARFFILFVFCFAPLWASSSAHAQAHRASCDEDFHDVLDARAWMLATREFETAQEFLIKPDSVLEYTCHDYTFEHDGSSRDDFDDALKDEYLDKNFSGDYGGGLINGTTGGGVCVGMADIWNAARCQDFSMADFINFTAGEYQGPRSCPSPTTRTNAWDAAVAASQPAAATPAASGGMEAVVTYLERMSWLEASNCSSSDAVDTGVKYRNAANTADVDEMVCLTPGCYFNGSSCQ